jgi:hypothetical protein
MDMLPESMCKLWTTSASAWLDRPPTRALGIAAGVDKQLASALFHKWFVTGSLSANLRMRLAFSD